MNPCKALAEKLVELDLNVNDNTQINYAASELTDQQYHKLGSLIRVTGLDSVVRSVKQELRNL